MVTDAQRAAAHRIAPFVLGPVGGTRRASAVRLDGTRILLTGASSGIGRAAALATAARGAELLLVARRAAELEQLCAEIAAAGGKAEYRACDMADQAQVAELVESLEGPVDVLINNAARSIRRPLTESLDRLHDFQRTMAVNYFGAVQLTLGVLPGMLARGGGHVLDVCTWMVAADSSPRFAAYHASKAALAGFNRSAGAELAAAGIACTTIGYPLVHTAMSSPTERYRRLPGLTPEQAADWILTALRTRPVRMVPRYAALLRAVNVISPRTVDRLLASRA